MGFKAPDSIAAPKIWTLPALDGTVGQVLITSGAGVLSWAANAATGMANPMTTIGDIIYGSTTANPAVPSRLAIGTAGQCLVVTGGKPAWGACTGTAAAAGTNGQIQFNNSGSFGANSSLVWDNTAKTFTVSAETIGTYAPLVLRNTNSGNASTNELQINNDVATSTLAIWVNSSTFTGANNAASIFNRQNAALTLGTNNVERMRIDNAGNVGIGTSSPSYLFDVAGTFRVAGTSIFDGNVGIGLATPTAALHLKAGTDAAGTAPLKFTAGTNLAAPEAGALEYDGVGLYITDGTSTRRTIATLDGIQTLTNETLINPLIQGTVSAGTGLTMPAFTLSGGIIGNGQNITGLGALDAASLAAPAITTSSGDLTLDPAGNVVIQGSTADGNAAALNVTDSASASLFYVRNNGNVGIGTTAPGEKLTVTSNISAPPGVLPIGTFLHFTQADGAANRMVFDSFGNMNIITMRRANGTAASPTGVLANDVLGNIGAFGYGTSAYAGSNRVSIGFYAEENWTNTAFGSYMAFLTNASGGASSTEKMRITGSGNVGIGTTEPQYALDVNGAINATSILVNGAPVGSGSGSSQWNSGDGGVISYSGGYVGIGTASPSMALQITGSSANETQLDQIRYGAGGPWHSFRRARGTKESPLAVQNGDPAGTVQFIGYDGTSWLNLATIGAYVDGTPGANDMPGRITFSTVPDNSIVQVERMRIDSSGNIGIGTTAPAYTVHAVRSGPAIFMAESYSNVAGDGSVMALRRAGGTIALPTATLDGQRLGAYNFIGYNGTTFGTTASAAIIANAAGDFSTTNRGAYFTFETIPTGSITRLERMRIDSNGNLGIGTANPQYKLDVAGIVNADAFLVRGVAIGESSSQWATGDSGVITYTGGNIGVGTTAPGYLMDIKANSSVGAAVFSGAGTDDAVFDGTYIGATATTYTVVIDSEGSPDTFKWKVGSGAYTSGVAITGAAQTLSNGVTIAFGSTTGHTLNDQWVSTITVTNPFAVQNAAGARSLYVGNDGNVGIGTTSPSSILHTFGSSVRFEISNSSVSTVPNGNGATVINLVNSNSTNNNTASLKFLSTNTAAALITGSAIETVFSSHTAGSESGILTFATRNSGTISERMRIDSTGNVGIGTTTPLVNLHVKSAGQTAVLAEAPVNFNAYYAGSIAGTLYSYLGTVGVPNAFANGSIIGDLAFRSDNRNILFSTDAGTTTQLYLKNGGNVGIGTTTPGARLDIGGISTALATTVGSNGGFGLSINSTGTPVAMGLENKAASGSLRGTGIGVYSNDGAAMDSGDRLGFMLFGGSINTTTTVNTAGFFAYASQAWADGSAYGTKFQIETTSDNSTSRTAKLTIDGTGNVGIGTTSPQRALHVYRSTDGAPVRFEDSNGYCEIDPTTTTWTCTSDLTMKKDISPLSGTDMLSRITALQGVNFRWKTQTDDTMRYGFIAQDVEKIFPEFVSTDEKGLRSVAYGAFTPALVEAIKAQQTQINGLELVLSATGAIGNASSTSELASGGGVGQWLADILDTLGMGLQNGIASLKELVVGKVRMDKMEMTDKSGNVWCVSLDENGEWVKTKGECGAAPEATDNSSNSSESGPTGSNTSNSGSGASGSNGAGNSGSSDTGTGSIGGSSGSSGEGTATSTPEGN